MGVCAVAAPSCIDAIGDVGSLTAAVVPCAPRQEQARRSSIALALLRHRDLAHRALLRAPRSSRGVASGLPRRVAVLQRKPPGRFPQLMHLRDADNMTSGSASPYYAS